MNTQDQNKVLEVITRRHVFYENYGKYITSSVTKIHMADGDVICRFAEAPTWQASGSLSLEAAMNAIGLTYEDVKGKVAFLVRRWFLREVQSTRKTCRLLTNTLEHMCRTVLPPLTTNEDYYHKTLWERVCLRMK